MKILRVISSVNPENGGPINGLINSSIELINLGHSIEIATLDPLNSTWLTNCKIKTHSFESSLGNYSYSSSLTQWLKKNVQKYDVVIIHGLWQFHSYISSKICLTYKVPYVVFTHGMLDPWFNTNKAKHVKKHLYWKLFENKVLNHASAVLFTSEEEKVLARSSFSPYSPNEKVVAYGSPGPSSDRIISTHTFYEEFPQLKDKKFALFLSRIDSKKGIDLLIEALGCIDKLPENFMLAIAGPDSNGLKAKLIKQINATNLSERVVWLGMLSGDLKWGAYYSSDVFVLPSHQENFGIVVAEALSTSTPVLITNKVNIWREIEADRAGFVESDTTKGIENLLKRWFDLSRDEKINISNRSRTCYDNNFSIKSAVKSLEDVLQNTIKDDNYD